MLSATHTLYLIRHGETDWNVEGRLQGGQEIALNDTGRQQARRVAHVLRRLGVDAGRVPFIVSPMGRTRMTTELLRGEMGLDPQAYRIDERLREISFGRWEALTWAQVQAQDPELARARERDKWNFVPPGGESYANLLTRIRPALVDALSPDGLAQDAGQGLSPQAGSERIIVSHGGVMRAALVAFGLSRPGQAETMEIWQGRVLVVRRGGFAWH